MKYVAAILGIFASYLIIKFRESLGNTIGDARWMRYVGGVYNLVVIVAILIFFWCIAILTGTEDFFFTPILNIIPAGHPVF